MDIHRASPEALRSTGRPAAARARHAPSPPVGLPRLQQTAGNAAVTGLVAARQVVTAPAPGGGPPTITTRPTLRLGDIDQQVGVAQQKLNVLGTTPELKIDAEFGSRTQIAVRTFQTANGVTASGALDTATWTRLDARAPGGDLRPDGTVAPVPGLRPGDPSPQPRPGLATHPTLKLTARGPAVSELHEKLNALGVGGGLPVGRGLAGAAAITFNAATDTAVGPSSGRTRRWSPTGKRESTPGPLSRPARARCGGRPECSRRGSRPRAGANSSTPTPPSAGLWNRTARRPRLAAPGPTTPSRTTR